MNAVRNDETPEGTWQIVPLTGGKTELTTMAGQVETLDDGNLAGFVGGYDFDMDFVAVENPHKSDDHHPDFHIEARSPAGVLIRMGSIWHATSARTGTKYLSLAFSSPMGIQYRANALPRTGDTAGLYEIVAQTGNDLFAVA